ncbi:MAG: metal-sulfur cluster assembly factor [Rhodocyclaceae bacterium]
MPPAPDSAPLDSETLDESHIRDLLRQVIDPEVGVNIVDLGLIYAIEVSPEGLRICMTMTSPACPMGEMIMDDIDRVLDAALPPEVRIDVELVWEPPWSPERMDPAARHHFGWKPNG